MKRIFLLLVAFGCLVNPNVAMSSYGDSVYRYSSEEPDKNNERRWLSHKSLQRGSEIRDEYIVIGDNFSKLYRITAFYDGGDGDNIKISDKRGKILAKYELYPNQIAIRKSRNYINIIFLFDDFDLGHFLFSRIENGRVYTFDCNYTKNKEYINIRGFLKNITLKDVNKTKYNCSNG